MIRFIDLGKQTSVDEESSEREFAFFDTVTDRFLEFQGRQVWDSWLDFVDDCQDKQLIRRVKWLLPAWVNGARTMADFQDSMQALIAALEATGMKRCACHGLFNCPDRPALSEEAQ